MADHQAYSIQGVTLSHWYKHTLGDIPHSLMYSIFPTIIFWKIQHYDSWTAKLAVMKLWQVALKCKPRNFLLKYKLIVPFKTVT